MDEKRLRDVGKNIWSRHLGVALCDTKMADETLRLRMVELYWNIIRIDILNVFKDEKRSTCEIILIYIVASIIVAYYTTQIQPS